MDRDRVDGTVHAARNVLDPVVVVCVAVTILQGDVVEKLREIPDQSVHCVVTSPPYWGLRDYQTEGQIGLEKTPDEYVSKMVGVFKQLWRVLRDDGTVWLNMGDCYGSGSRKTQVPQTVANGCDQDLPLNNRGKQGFDKQLIGMPWRLAFALQAPTFTCHGCNETNHSMKWGRFPNGRWICPSCEKSKGHDIINGWYLRSDIIWSKPNPMPESVTDRPTKSHEYVFLLTKKARYYYDADAIREGDNKGFRKAGLPKYEEDGTLETYNATKGGFAKNDLSWVGRNRRTVWEIATQPFPEAHFATFPEALVEPCIKAGTSERGCCSKCGAPWERLTENISMPFENGLISRKISEVNKVSPSSIFRTGIQNIPKTTGWQPTCKCEGYYDFDQEKWFDYQKTVPCIVLDPFMGSGTTLKVARDLKRDAIGIEINPEYVKIARERLRLNEQLFSVEVPA